MIQKLEDIRQKYEQIRARLSDPAFVQDHRAVREAQKTLSEFEPIIAKTEEHRRIARELEGAREMAESLSPGDELHQMATAERASLTARLSEVEQQIQLLLVPKDPNDSRNVFLEIRAGTGGEEAALFAGELFRMYQRYAERRRWKVEVVDRDDTGVGGLKAVTALIEGEGAYSRLKYEGGVHRVQRVPQTESAGRIHTSAATVAVLPEAEDVDVKVEVKDIRPWTGSAPRAPAVRASTRPIPPCGSTHLPTGLVVQCQDERSQLKNKAKAMRVLKLAAARDSRTGEGEGASRGRTQEAMVGSGDRSERIRTYNFPQNRITDHRIGFTTHRMTDVLDGNLDELVDPLSSQFQAQRLKEELAKA